MGWGTPGHSGMERKSWGVNKKQPLEQVGLGWPEVNEGVFENVSQTLGVALGSHM